MVPRPHPRTDGARLVADLDLYDGENQLVATFRGIRSQRVAGDDGEEKLDALLYAYQWQPQPLLAGQAFQPDSQAEKPDLRQSSWLIFADRGGVGEQLAERLRDAGAACTLVFVADAFAHGSDDRYEIDPSRGEDMTQLLQAVLAPGRLPCRGIIHLWNLEAPAPEELSVSDLEAAQEAGLFSVLHLVQAWEKTSSAAETPLVLVMRGAQSVGDKPMPVAVAQSPAIGLGRVIANESSRLRGKTVDLDPAHQSADIGRRCSTN